MKPVEIAASLLRNDLGPDICRAASRVLSTALDIDVFMSDPDTAASPEAASASYLLNRACDRRSEAAPLRDAHRQAVQQLNEALKQVAA